MRLPTSRLNSVDLPTLGRPMMMTWGFMLTDLPQRVLPELASTCFGHRRIFAEVVVPGLDRAVELDGQRPAMAIHRLAGLYPHPAFGTAIFLDIGAHPILKTDAHSALELVGIEPGTVRADRQAIGWGVSYGLVAHASFCWIVLWRQWSMRT